MRKSSMFRAPAIIAALAGGLVLSVCTNVLAAEASPVGMWKSIDDETGTAKALIRIEEASGVLIGKIVQVLTAGREDAVCSKCEGPLKDKPIKGMQILQGLKKEGEWYEGGTILDPAKGKTYSSQLRMTEQGRQLEVRGFIGTPFFGRSQTWIRQP